MDDYIGFAMVIASCVFVLLIISFRKKKEWIINFILRGVMGTITIYFVNEFLSSQDILISIGINPLTVLTSGFLGFPGLVMLYGINLYGIL